MFSRSLENAARSKGSGCFGRTLHDARKLPTQRTSDVLKSSFTSRDGLLDRRCMRILSGVPTDPHTEGAAEQSVALAWWNVSGATRIHPLFFSEPFTTSSARGKPNFSMGVSLEPQLWLFHALRVTETRCGLPQFCHTCYAKTCPEMQNKALHR